MLRYLVRRVLWAVVLCLGVTFVAFVIFYLTPADPARARCGGDKASPQCIAAARIKLGLDKPVPVQYYRFVRSLVVNHSLGHSFLSDEDVNTIVASAAPVTASLVFGGVVIWLTIGLAVGILSALRPRSLLDRAAMVLVLIGVSAHPVWFALLLSYVFGYKLGLTPIAGYADFFNPPPGEPGGLWPWFSHLVLPWFAFAIPFAALYVRMIRANMLETINEDFVRTARAKGAPTRRVVGVHVLRNALLPVLSMLGMDIGIALGGVVFTETVFNLPGLGSTMITAINQGDLVVVQGVLLFATFAIVFFNLIVDLLYAWADPRIRFV